MDRQALLQEYWTLLHLVKGEISERYRGPIPPMPTLKESPHRAKTKEKDSLSAVTRDVSSCTRCRFHHFRKGAIAGSGAKEVLLFIIMDPPNKEADEHQRPLSLEEAEMLKRWVEAIDLSLEKECFLTNIVKCRPPAERAPFTEELRVCSAYLKRQIALTRPRALLWLSSLPISFIEKESEIPVFSTHPPHLVKKDPSLKRAVWEELKRIKALLKG